MKLVGKILKIFVILIVVILASYTFFEKKWQHDVESFCADVRPGMNLQTLSELEEKKGVARNFGSTSVKGIFDKKENQWVSFVIVPLTMGGSSCTIRHDGDKVISAEMDWD